MRPAERGEEEPGNQTQPATMRPAERGEEEPGNRFEPRLGGADV